MKRIVRTVAVLFGLCDHYSRYQERRDGIMHYICEDCGDATTMPRSEDEHRAMIAKGQIVWSEARKVGS